MSIDKRQRTREDRCKEIVTYARENSAFYRQLYKDEPQNFTLEDVAAVDKSTLMANWDSWVCDRNLKLADVNEFMKDKSNIGSKFKNEYMVFTTSGSTGNPLVAVYDKNANNIMGGIAANRSYARKEDLKAFMKNGKKSMAVFADSGFYLGNSSIQSRLKSMPWKRKQMAVSSALYPMDKIVKQLNEFQPAMLGGYPSHLELLIEEAKAGRLNISPVIIMTGGEYLSDDLRKRLAETFNCYVQTSYSCTEGGTVACECTHQHFHINDDWLIVEPVDKDGNPVADGVLSDKILLTNLYNYAQPFIRYEVTDRVIMHHESCPCGNPSPWIELEGRTDDITVFIQDGKEISIAPLAVYAVLKEVENLRRFQVLVYSDNRIELRIEEQKGTDKLSVFENAKSSLCQYLATQGIFAVEVTLSDEQPQQNPNSGKFKHIVNMQK
jgi:phenylacetate-coenzyme A ligase PaaK-like adenylate-forming protein